MPLNSFWILVADLFFSLMALAVKIASSEIGPFEVLFYRSFTGTLFIAIYMRYKGIPFSSQFPLSHFKRCITGTSCFYLEIVALSLLPLSIVQSIEYTSPLIFAIFIVISSLATKAKIEIPLLGCIILGFLGVLLVIQPWNVQEKMTVSGLSIALIASFLAACVSWFLRTLAQQKEACERTVFYFMLCNCIIGFLGIILFDGFHVPTNQSTWLAIIAIAFFGLIAQIIWTYAWTAGHPLLNAVFQFVGIFYGAILGVIFLSESLKMSTLIGMLLIFLAGIFSTLYLKTNKKSSV